MNGFFEQHGEMALFLAIALGHLVGRLRLGPVELGGVCGTLLMALLIGQLGVRVDPDLKSIFFALFIFALGYTGGPQFFANIRSGWRFGMLSLIEVFTVLALVLGAAVLLQLNAGAASGLLAGAATESAVIGTASEAVSRLGLSAGETQALQGQIATAYSITYLFGLVTIVVFTSQIAPLLVGIDLRSAAAALARKLGEGAAEDQPALPELVGRSFRAGRAGGMSVSAFEAEADHAVTVVRIGRLGEQSEPSPATVIGAEDELLLVGRREAIIAAAGRLGPELVGRDIDLPVASRDYVLSQRSVAGRTLAEIRRLAPLDLRRGVFIARLQRLGRDMPLLPEVVLQSGDVVRLFGPERAVSRAGAVLGRAVPADDKTDFIMLGTGVLIGALLGLAGVQLGGIHLTLGVGGGCLLSGLVFGWYASRHAATGVLPASAAQILKDFGLSAFIACVGFSAGPEAFDLVREYGIWLPLAGILMALVPAAVSLFVGHKLLKIELPFLLGAIAGQQCSTPAISSLVNTAGNSTPVVGYTVTYAISNVLLPLLGPIVVGLVFHLV